MYGSLTLLACSLPLSCTLTLACCCTALLHPYISSVPLLPETVSLKIEQTCKEKNDYNDIQFQFLPQLDWSLSSPPPVMLPHPLLPLLALSHHTNYQLVGQHNGPLIIDM